MTMTDSKVNDNQPTNELCLLSKSKKTPINQLNDWLTILNQAALICEVL